MMGPTLLEASRAQNLTFVGYNGRLLAANDRRAWRRSQRRFNRSALGYLRLEGGTSTPQSTLAVSVTALTCSQQRTIVDFTAESIANVLRNQSPLGFLVQCLVLTFSISPLCYRTQCNKLFVVRKVATSSNHPRGDDGVDHVNHTMTKCWVVAINERQGEYSSVPAPTYRI